MMMGIHWRLAELWLLQQKRDLTEDERLEMSYCMKLNATYAQKLSDQYNYALMASMTNDWVWLHEVSTEIDKLEASYKIKKPSIER